MAEKKPPKVAKPYPDFPLTPHPRGQWCKKIRGKLFYFGPVSAPDEALKKYLEERDDLQAGRTPKRRSGKKTLADIVNLYLARCEERVSTGELSPLSFADYHEVGRQLVAHLGRHTDPEKLRPQDFASFRAKFAAKYAPSRLSKFVTVVRQILKWAYESELIDKMPRFGPDFSVAGKKELRLQKARQGKKLLSAEELRALLAVADAKWKAVLLLCINGGLGNSDIARLTLSDVESEWLDLPRGKTGIDRRIPLWSETRAAIKEAIRHRPKPKSEVSERLLFLSEHGGPLISMRGSGKRTDLTAHGFRRIAKKSGIHRERMGLYWCRHTFQTVADEAGDPVATSSIMGHVDGSMAGQYRERISDARLLKVTEHVRNWLFSEEKSGG